MRPIGGFFDLELPSNGYSPHPKAAALSTGRACMALWINKVRPSRVYVPYYCCDALFQPLQQAGIPIIFYAIDENLSETGLPAVPKSDEWLVWTNYFGILGDRVRNLAQVWKNRLLVDNTHSFFEPCEDGLWSFTSARKYFGVTDGAYCFSPNGKLDVSSLERFVPPNASHLVARFTEGKDDAFSLFTDAEAAMDSSLMRISHLSERIMAGIDYQSIRERRSLNISILARELADYNSLTLGPKAEEHSAFCYPFVPEKKILRSQLHSQGIYIPTLWADTLNRDNVGFEFERRLSEDLLPLPVDHRYQSSDMLQLAKILKEHMF